MKPGWRIWVRNWWPVAVWLGVIRLESTNFASSQNTFHLLYRFLLILFGEIDVRVVADLDHVLRKSGHFIGYAILSGLTFLAMRNTYRERTHGDLPHDGAMQRRWQLNWAAVAMLITIATASLDEIHQTFLPSRTGRWQDVVIDSSGALVLQIAIYIICQLRELGSRRHRAVPHPQLTAE